MTIYILYCTVYLIFISSISLLFIFDTLKETNHIYSSVDLFMHIRSNYIFDLLLLPLTILFFHYTTASNLTPNFVLKFNKKRDLWILNLFQILMYSFVISFIISLLSVFLGNIYKNKINWNQFNSFFMNCTQKTSNISYYTILIYFFLSIFFSLITAAILTCFITWFIKPYFVSFILLIIFIIFDTYNNNFHFLFGRISLYYNNITEKIYFINYIIIIIFLIFISFLGYYFSKYKEFYND